MIQNFRVLNIKDTENPLETIISGIPPSNISAAAGARNITFVTSSQQEITDNFDTFIEKRNKES